MTNASLTAMILLHLQILASYMKKLGRRHDNAMNGLEAFEACRSRQTHYKCIFMGKSISYMEIACFFSFRHNASFSPSSFSLPIHVVGVVYGTFPF